MNASSKMVEYLSSLKFVDLSSETVESTRSLYLDYLGLSLRGSAAESSAPVINMLKNRLPGNSTSVVSGTDITTSPEYAVIANGCFAHSLELDDVVNEASLHPAVAVFPAATAISEMTGASGKDLITASAVGYEIMIRLGRALNPREHYRRGFHPTGTCGTFAAAAVASRLLNLREDEFLNALGIAASQAAASMEFLADGAWTKRFHPGWACHSGIIAAFLASEGFKGPSRPIEGKNGFLSSYSEAPSPELVDKDLGGRLLINDTSIKPHACCRYNQAPIDAIQEILKSHRVPVEEIEKIKIGAVKTAFPIVIEPEEHKKAPQSVVDAQFSLPFAAAVTLLKNRASLDEYTLQMIGSQEVKILMQKVECYTDEELNAEFPQKWPARVNIYTTKGENYQAKIDYPRGDPQNPLSWDELVQKFNDVVNNLNKETKNKIINKVKDLENIKISSLSRHLKA